MNNRALAPAPLPGVPLGGGRSVGSWRAAGRWLGRFVLACRLLRWFVRLFQAGALRCPLMPAGRCRRFAVACCFGLTRKTYMAPTCETSTPENHKGLQAIACNPLFYWWARTDLNRGPKDYESCRNGVYQC